MDATNRCKVSFYVDCCWIVLDAGAVAAFGFPLDLGRRGWFTFQELSFGSNTCSGSTWCGNGAGASKQLMLRGTWIALWFGNRAPMTA